MTIRAGGSGGGSDIDPETLMAYADGELSLIEAKRIERAIAADPALAEQIDRHRQLRAMLANGFAPVLDAPVPNRLQAMIQSAPVIDLATVRATRAAGVRAAGWSRWVSGGAIAASLVVGLMLGRGLDTGPVAVRGGALVASGGLARALDTQLASAEGTPAGLHGLITFRDRSGALCRSFSGQSVSGIACRAGDDWVLRETRGGAAAPATDYRQAGSGDPALMAAAQAMMAGDPLDADAEAKARANGWR